MTDKNINEAFLEVQKQIETIKKDATANAGKFTYSYATLGQVMEMIKKPLNDNGFYVIQPITGSTVVTCLVYTNGNEIKDGGTPIICARPDDPQAQGSAISYARRYGLMSLLFLSAEDDDGVKAMPHTQVAPPTVVKQATAPTTNVYQRNEFSESNCKECGGEIKISMAGKPYCANRCWLPEGNHFRTEFKAKLPDVVRPAEDIISDAEMQAISDMPF